MGINRRIMPVVAGVLLGVLAWSVNVNLGSRAVEQERPLISMPEAKAFVQSLWNKAQRAAGWVGRQARAAVDFTWNGVKWTAGKIKAAATTIFNKGKSFLVGQLKAAWQAIKKLDCSGLVAAIAPFANPLYYGLSKLIPGGYGTTCYNNLYAGFICGIPDAIISIGKMIWGIGEAVWKNRGTCLKFGVAASPLFAYMGPLAPSAGLLMCGTFYYLKDAVTKFVDTIKKAYQCFSAMSKDKLVHLVLNQAIGTVCNILGSVAFDIVLNVLTAGGGAPATVAKWINKIKTILDKLQPLQYLKKIGADKIKNAMSYTGRFADEVAGGLYDQATKHFGDQLKNLKECGGKGVQSSPSKPKPVVQPKPAATPKLVPMSAKKTTVKASRWSFRSGPSTSYKRLGWLYRGKVIYLVGKIGEWYKIKYNGSYGYAHKDGINLGATVTPKPAATPKFKKGWGTITWTRVNMRSGATDKSRILRKLYKGNRVYVYYQKGGYYRIRYGSRSYGYVWTKAVKR